MSKRSEERAFEAYPDHTAQNGERISYRGIRILYIEAYEQAEKDTIERAVNVLINLPSLVIPSNYIAYFRKKMMEEE